MAKIPDQLLVILAEASERNIAIVCEHLKINRLPVYKDFIAKNRASREPYKSFLTEQFTKGNKSTLQSIYGSIEGFLFVGGCAPGVGIVFNIIDACFCAALGNWFSALIAIVSCFPIPGFKVAGKGIEKLLMKLLHSIPISDFAKFTKMIGKRLQSIGFHSTEAYINIRKQLEMLIPELNNPFAEEAIRVLSSILKKYPTVVKTMTKTTGQTTNRVGSLTTTLDAKITQHATNTQNYSLVEKGISKQ